MYRISACAGTLQNSFQDMLGMKTKLNVFNPNDPNAAKIKFKDVAGLHEAKVEIREFVDYLKHPEKYTASCNACSITLYCSQHFFHEVAGDFEIGNF